MYLFSREPIIPAFRMELIELPITVPLVLQVAVGVLCELELTEVLQYIPDTAKFISSEAFYKASPAHQWV